MNPTSERHDAASDLHKNAAGLLLAEGDTEKKAIFDLHFKKAKHHDISARILRKQESLLEKLNAQEKAIARDILLAQQVKKVSGKITQKTRHLNKLGEKVVPALDRVVEEKPFTGCEIRQTLNEFTYADPEYTDIKEFDPTNEYDRELMSVMCEKLGKEQEETLEKLMNLYSK